MRVFVPSTLTTLLLLFLVSPTESRAQFSFTALEGIPTARKMAIDSLGAGPELISIATVGEVDMQGFPLSFDLETGEAMVWIYLYRGSGQNDLLSVAVIRIFAFQAFSGGEVTLPPFGEYEPVTTTGPYADSDAMVDRLDRNSTYTKYRQDLPGSLPEFITFGRVVPDGLPLPDEIPIGQSVWVVSFSGMGDSSMTCFVGASDGATFCMRIPSISGVEDEGVGRQKGIRLEGANPVRRGESVKIVLDGGIPSSSDAELLLYNSLGERVGDFSQKLRSSGGSGAYILIETSPLPSGSYHLLLRTPNGRERLGLVVQ